MLIEVISFTLIGIFGVPIIVYGFSRRYIGISKYDNDLITECPVVDRTYNRYNEHHAHHGHHAHHAHHAHYAHYTHH